jgi:hypothetical protein
LDGTGGAGVTKYNNINISTGVITEELLCVDDDMHLYTSNSFTATYSGSSSAYYDLYWDKDNDAFFFDLYDNNVRVLNQNLGTGLGVSDTTVDQLVTAINAVTDFSASVSGSPSTPAAFMPLGRSIAVTATLNWFTWTAVDTPNNYTTPFSSHWAARNDSDFELASFANTSDVLYISNGYDEMHKYDANRVYRVGMPQPASLAVAEVAGSTFAASEVYTHKAVYEYTDAKGNIITGTSKNSTAFTMTGTFDLQVTVANIQDTTGFNTDQATINGNQSGVRTITVNSGHNIKVDDTVYINDGITGTVVSRVITAVTATTIAFATSEDTVDVTNAEIISCIKIRLFRTKNGGSLYYEIKELINDSGNATQAYTDNNADSALVADYVEPVKPASLPPKCKYMDVWRDQIVLSGNRESVNNVYYSDIAGPEYFPSDNSFTVSSRRGGGNTGVGALDNVLFIFKPEAVISVTGDLGTDSFQTDQFSDEGYGCVSHNTIQEVSGRLFFLGKRGVHSVGQSDIRNESDPVDPRFDNSYSEKQCNAFHWVNKDLYVLILTILDEDGSSQKYMNSTTKCLVFDYFRQAWFEWSSWNMIGGMAEYNNDVYLQGRELDVASASQNRTSVVLQAGTFDDYMDHSTAISLSYKGHWEALGEPSVFKKFLRLKVHSLDGSINDFEGNDFSLAITTEHDYSSATVSDFSLDFSGGASGWGESAWGDFPWGESRLPSLKSKLASRKAKSLRVSFTNSNEIENILVSGYELEIATPYDMAIKE